MTAARQPPGSTGASDSIKTLALIAAILASTIAAVDSTAVNVALPAIGRDLGGGFAAQQWVSNSYLLTLSALILLAGSLTDKLGERRIFTAGVAGFGIGSALCAASPTIGILIVARALQGVSGAMLTPSALAILVSVFPRQERGAAIGKWTAWGGIGILAGPLLGGQIVDSLSWRWIFVINVPLVMAALALSRIAVPGRAATARDARIDWLGAALAAVGLTGMSFGLIEQPVLGWSDPGVWGALVIGVCTFGAFIVHEARAPAPMLPLGLFRHRNFSVANAQTFAIYGGIGLLGFFVTIYLQQVAGYSALKSGVTGLVPTAVMFVLSGRMGKLADRYGPRPFLTIGPLIVAAGFGLMQRYGTSVSLTTDVLPALLVFSFGLSMTVAPLTATVLADASEADAGIASAVNNAIARTAGLLAVAAVGAVVSSYYGALLNQRLSDRLPASAQAALQQAKRRTFGTIDAAAVPAAQRTYARQVTATASEDAFHVAVGIASGLLVVAGIGGLTLRSKPETAVVAADCAGGQLAGQPRLVGDAGVGLAQPTRSA
ncbi:MAG TPA: DHA2 family efflux MFS transporter permease subunit [Solirubrobacteraceae bacterium]|jgi:EmrB/QacA subfamily drug resistance transporter|nr:DHA2 family efflux MFS transporter permease subunit [Solirubrobacteraceae bacterium]